MDFEELIGCVVALAFVAGVVAFVVWLVKSLGRTARLERRLDELERDLGSRLARLEAGGGALEPGVDEPPEAPPVAVPSAMPPPLPAAAETAEMPALSEPPAAAPAAAPPELPAAAPPGRPKRSLEEVLGARLPIWIGALALVAAAIFLVKYSVDQGWIVPEVRVALGVGFGLALLVAGRLLRRSAERIAAALAAAGVAALYASFLAAVELYHLIPPAVGFALMAATTAAAVALSLVHGPIVAVVGLLGGFVTPFFLRAAAPDPRGLFAYLLLLHVALLWVARRRFWNLLSLASLFAGLAWVLLWLAGEWDAGDGPWLLVFVLAALSCWLLAAHGAAGSDRLSVLRRVLAAAAAAVSFFVAGAVTARAEFSSFEWALVALLVAGLLFVARRRDDLHALAWVGAAGAVLLLVGWGLGLRWVSADLPRFLVVAGGLGALTAGGSYAALWGSRRPASWASLAASCAFVFTTVAWLGWRQVPVDETATAAGGAVWPWVVATLALALLAALAALPLAARREEAGFDGALAAFAAAASAFVALAAVQGLDGEALTVALALELPALAWLAGRFRLPVIVKLAAPLAAVVAVRLLLNPWPLAASAGEPRLWNLLLWTYGPAFAAVAAAALLLDRAAARPLSWARRLSELLRWEALALGLALVTLEVRHAFHPAYPAFDWDGPAPEAVGTLEWALVAIAWTAVGAALLWLAARRPAPLGTLGPYGSRLLISVGLASALLGPCLVVDPLWKADAVGPWPLLNHLLWIYLVPAALATWAALRLSTDDADRRLRFGWRLGALGLLFTWATLAARQPYRGSLMTHGSMNASAEGWTVSAAWLLLATALLVAGIATGSRLLRGASLAVFGLAVVKVFLFDVAALGDLYRVLSFLGLGASLLLLAWLYQRYVFGGGEGRT